MAPFGGPVFILAARGGSATLLLTREERIIRNAPPEAILGALTGVALDPADLLAVFTGCVVPGPRATAGRLHAGGLASIDVESADQGTQRRTATVYLRRNGSQWQLRAAKRDRLADRVHTRDRIVSAVGAAHLDESGCPRWHHCIAVAD